MSISSNKIKELENILNVTAENHNIIGGLGSAVAEVLGENYPVAMKRVGIKDVFVECGKNDELLRKYDMSIEHIAEVAREVIKMKEALREVSIARG
ncbi:hypothetical protein CVT91_09235 [Candidatus Atribacteria bacterium HGW-Atribacteria-1]|nr:MAG: hypothetical protein CVT91_09235 [Candidatus Atribacteria bacterium HGW-Atribacteria-1]